MKIIKIVLDVMSPAQQSIVDLVGILNAIDGVAQVDIALSELEKNVEDIKVTIEGFNLDYERIRSAIKEFGGVIRGVDNIVSAEEYAPRQDHDKLSASMLVLANHFNTTVSNMDKIFTEFDEALSYIKSKKGK